MIVANENTIEAVAALSDVGKYVAVDVQSMNTVAETTTGKDDDDDEDDGTGVRLLPEHLRDRDAQQGADRRHRGHGSHLFLRRRLPAQGAAGRLIRRLFAGEDEGTGNNEKTEVLYAALTVGGETRPRNTIASRPRTISVVDFYDETGKSAKKFLVRKPVNSAIMRSGFGGRRHPIWAMPRCTRRGLGTPYGTPIFASGNGVVEKVGWKAAMAICPPENKQRLRDRLRPYVRLCQGHGGWQAGAPGPGDGFVGSTGMSTGAHVHYENLVNGRFVDPMRVKLPRGRSLEGTVMASFEKSGIASISR